MVQNGREKELMDKMLAATLWYILITILGIAAAIGYNSWIDNKNREKYQIPSSILTSFGVAGVEIMRVIRSAPLAWLVVDYCNSLDVVSVVGLFIAWYTVDAITAYSLTGLVMIGGNLHREVARSVDEQLEVAVTLGEKLQDTFERGKDW